MYYRWRGVGRHSVPGHRRPKEKSSGGSSYVVDTQSRRSSPPPTHPHQHQPARTRTRTRTRTHAHHTRAHSTPCLVYVDRLLDSVIWFPSSAGVTFRGRGAVRPDFLCLMRFQGERHTTRGGRGGGPFWRAVRPLSAVSSPLPTAVSPPSLQACPSQSTFRQDSVGCSYLGAVRECSLCMVPGG